VNKPANRLGRGLSALIPNRDQKPAAKPEKLASQETELPAIQSGLVTRIPVASIHPNPNQPRTTFDDTALAELAESIRANGVIQPIIVRIAKAATGDKPAGFPHEQQYELVAGERRWRASTIAGIATVPAIIRDVTDAQSLELALIENLQRADLGPLERASAYQHYLDSFGGSVEDLAAKLSESRANVSNYLRLLKLRPEICYMLGSGELGMGQARAVAGIADPERQMAVAKLAARRNLSVRQVEELARSETSEPVSRETPPPTSDTELRAKHFSDVGASLTKHTGLRISLFPGRKKNSGRVVITYKSLEEFDLIAQRLGGKPTIE